jgi:hypothetical protein
VLSHAVLPVKSISHHHVHWVLVVERIVGVMTMLRVPPFPPTNSGRNPMLCIVNAGITRSTTVHDWLEIILKGQEDEKQRAKEAMVHANHGQSVKFNMNDNLDLVLDFLAITKNREELKLSFAGQLERYIGAMPALQRRSYMAMASSLVGLLDREQGGSSIVDPPKVRNLQSG